MSLKYLREKAGYTVKEVSKYCNVSVSMMYKIETGKRSPGPYVAAKMSELYEVSIKAIYMEGQYEKRNL